MTLQIASKWFERRTLGDGVTLLWEPHVTPLFRCNIWHVSGRDHGGNDPSFGRARLIELVDAYLARRT